jgi:hypothetical protein
VCQFLLNFFYLFKNNSNMKYLQTYDSEEIYNTTIGDNPFYSITPNTSLISSTDSIRYLKKPKRTITYENFNNGLFLNGWNIKRIWNNNKVIYENNNEFKKHKTVITPEDVRVSDEGIYFSYVNPEIAINSPISNNIVISCDEGIDISSDHIIIGFHMLDGRWAGMGVPIYESMLVDGKIHITNDSYTSVEYTGEWFVVFYQTGVKIKTTTIEWDGPDGKIEEYLENRGDNVPEITDGFIEWIKITALTDLNESDGCFVTIIYDGVAQTDIAPIQFLREYGFMIDDKTLLYPIGGNIGANIKMGFCGVSYDENSEVIPEPAYLIDCNITVKRFLTPALIDVNSLVGNKITVETYHRSYTANVRGTNIRALSSDFFKYNKHIGQQQFEDCTYLTELKIPNGVTQIGSDAFYNCINLTNVILPKTLTSWTIKAFDGCSALKDITCHVPITERLYVPNNAPKGGIIRVPTGTDIAYLSDYIYKEWTIEFI